MSPIPSQADAVVIGSGVSGLAAALTLAEGGASVVVFEKERATGGSSNFFKGMFAVESEMQRERYITYTRDEAFKNLMEYSHWRANPRLVRAYVDETAETIAWLQKQGVEFSDATINIIDSPRTYHVVKGEGAAVIKTLIMRAKEKGVNISLATPVKRILKEGDRINGVVVEENEEEKVVNARVVMVATGGYANNKEMVKKYSGLDLGVNLLPFGNVDKTGDGIRMAWEIGAAEEGLGNLELYRTGPIDAQSTSGGGDIDFAVIQPDLWVNTHGERFCDEGITFFDTSSGNVNVKSKEGYTWTVFDDSIKQSMIENGVERSMSIHFSPGIRIRNLDNSLKTAVAKGSKDIFEANSVEELAEKMGLNPEVLKATVDEYNGFCQKGHDDLFAKNRKYLRPLIGPIFYAIKAYTVFLGTFGGIKINHKAEVVDKKDKVIPGLYAGGFDAGGLYGQDYPMKEASGTAAGFATNSGRIAGKNALKYLGK
jgi:fumarate reductase flavoprotein subunit